MTLHVVLGLGFGDEGKGSIVDWLARQASAPVIVRWNGGPQAAHHVVTDDGRTHCFAQFGAGSFVDGARTHLGADMAIDPYALHEEAAALARVGIADALGRLSIDPRAIVVTPWHAIVNRIRERLRGAARHGTTGRGVGEAKLGAVRLVAGELAALDAPMQRLRAALREQARALAAGTTDPEIHALVARAEDRDLVDAFDDACHRLRVPITTACPRAETVILESAQGALLDRDHGFFPHVTPSRITRAAAETALGELGLAGDLAVWGVLRAVHTRHGEGPLPSEDAALAAALRESHNREDGPAGRFRVGWFDGVLARYAIAFAGPIDRLAITWLDRVAALPELAVVDAWSGGSELTAPDRTALALAAVPVVRPLARGELVPAIEQLVGRRVDVESWGPTASGKRTRSMGSTSRL